MKKVKTSADLDEAIAELERKAAVQKKEIQETYLAVTENLTPLKLVKSGVRSIFSEGTKVDLLNVLLGIGSGFLGRKVLLGKTSGLFGKTLGRAVQWGLTGLVSKNAEKIKEKGGELIDRFFRKHITKTNHTPPALPERKKTTP